MGAREVRVEVGQRPRGAHPGRLMGRDPLGELSSLVRVESVELSAVAGALLFSLE